MTRRRLTALAAAAITLPAGLLALLIVWAERAGDLGTWIP